MKQGERIVFPPGHVTDKKLPLLFCANKLYFRNGRGGLLSHKISRVCCADNLRQGGGRSRVIATVSIIFVNIFVML